MRIQEGKQITLRRMQEVEVCLTSPVVNAVRENVTSMPYYFSYVLWTIITNHWTLQGTDNERKMICPVTDHIMQ